MLLNGHDVPFVAGDDLVQAVAGDISPGCRPVLASVAMIVNRGCVAVVIFIDTPSAIVHVVEFDVLDSGRREETWNMLDSVLGEAVADEEDLQLGVRLYRRLRILDSDEVCDVVQGCLAGSLDTEVVHLGRVGIFIGHALAVVVGSDGASGDAAAPRCQAVVVGPEQTTVLVV